MTLVSANVLVVQSRTRRYGLGVPLEVSTSRLRGRARTHLRGLVTRRSGRCRSTASSRRTGRGSTGWRSCSPSRSVPPSATSWDERFGLGYRPTALIVAVIIGAVALSHLGFGANAVLTFRLAYVLTRPLGASVGDASPRLTPTATSAWAPRGSARCSSSRSSRWCCTSGSPAATRQWCRTPSPCRGVGRLTAGRPPVGCADRWRRRLAVWTASRRSAAGRASPGR
jgi:hypothetical protein